MFLEMLKMSTLMGMKPSMGRMHKNMDDRDDAQGSSACSFIMIQVVHVTSLLIET